jgi:FlaA1/EpsC-like NDP-sugar epimerase
MGPRVIGAVAVGVTTSALVLALGGLLSRSASLPIESVVIYWSLALVYVGSSRFLARNLMNLRRAGQEQVVIYGAGSSGAQVAQALQITGRFEPVAFVDDDVALQGSLVAGCEVLAPSALENLVAGESVRSVLLALPSASRRRRKEILTGLEPLAVRVMTVPDLTDLVAGSARIDDFRDIDVSDLLGRDPVPPNRTLLDACIRGKSVMVTGAGGSIGSELCRQIIALDPRRLVLFEMSEVALYTIEQELLAYLEKEEEQVEVIALLGNAHHEPRVRDIVRTYGIQTIYHAAAYKHVPIVEQNVIAGVYNNVFSTLHTAQAALDAGVEAFVLISTDKAVSPTNVMGATKRLAEMLLQALQATTTRTRFCMVRFGNVLGSSGSVVPRFREQIRAGGPVTVTHREITRYFMTVTEAAQLVLQAGSMGRGGDVFVLDMGQPVKIDELARRMIALMGRTIRDEANPNGDIEIRYTGLRPAEKLHEELLIGEDVHGTEHPMILRAVEHASTWAEIRPLLSDLAVALEKSDCKGIIAVLERAVSEYRKAPVVHDLVWSRRNATVAPLPDKVTLLADRRP